MDFGRKLVGEALGTGCSRARSKASPFAVGAYITAAYWLTASTSFANPAVTLARSMTNTFSGIRPLDLPGFVGLQFIGAVAASFVWSWLLHPERKSNHGG